MSEAKIGGGVGEAVVVVVEVGRVGVEIPSEVEGNIGIGAGTGPAVDVGTGVGFGLTVDVGSAVEVGLVVTVEVGKVGPVVDVEEGIDEGVGLASGAGTLAPPQATETNTKTITGRTLLTRPIAYVISVLQ